MLKVQNIKLRKTAQVFHSLGFFWAHETGMFDLEIEKDCGVPASDPSATKDELGEDWRMWAARETQLLALLGEHVSNKSVVVEMIFAVAISISICLTQLKTIMFLTPSFQTAQALPPNDTHHTAYQYLQAMPYSALTTP
ncbi:hypothetical protein A1O7_07307 [Cladophialophora yegresii CBS 114405]|uniref:Uncharacterized protein n=1 Tax=Cladophialophora yegresii CBS 114405 TaxID=1182544 RepID=W9VN58_9EURO|nr:uncharacterized protein A1O7_07307 [Cladophialophora yegresii CBS 114405]EXJ56963.1 hypothetical protein A1O7_07307 [Cladophialophora yegresii CBS 114405]